MNRQKTIKALVEILDDLLAPLMAYPHWWVATCFAIVAAAVLWMVVKALKWLLFTVLITVLLVGGVLVVMFFFK